MNPKLLLVEDEPSLAMVLADRLEREGAAFHGAVRRAYRDLAPARGWVVVDANSNVDDVAARLEAAVAPLLAG